MGSVVKRSKGVHELEARIQGGVVQGLPVADGVVTGAPVWRLRPRTSRLSRLPSSALEGASTLESRTLPKIIIGGFVSLVAIQLWLAF